MQLVRQSAVHDAPVQLAMSSDFFLLQVHPFSLQMARSSRGQQISHRISVPFLYAAHELPRHGFLLYVKSGGPQVPGLYSLRKHEPLQHWQSSWQLLPFAKQVEPMQVPWKQLWGEQRLVQQSESSVQVPPCEEHACTVARRAKTQIMLKSCYCATRKGKSCGFFFQLDPKRQSELN